MSPAGSSAAAARPRTATATAAAASGGEARRDRVGTGLAVAAVVVVAAGVALRFVSASPLWLDEALTVNIADLPLSEIPEALRHDGHPPLYYVLLHGWARVFGTGDLAVRSLSGLLGVGSLVLAWFAGRRLAGRAGSIVAVLLLASSPFAVRYAAEARMYALVMVLVLAGYLLLWRALDAPTLGRLAPVALVTAALLYTHYWSIFLVGIVAAGLAWASWRGPRRAAARWCLVAVAVGGVLYLPWVGTMLYQAARTGTPWGGPISLLDGLFVTLTDFGGGPRAEYRLLGILLIDAAALGVLARPEGAWRVVLELRTRPGVRAVAATVASTFLVGMVAGRLTESAFQSRYTAVVLPLFLLVVAYGVLAFAGRGPRSVVLALICGIGLLASIDSATTVRTQAREVADAIEASATPGDVVVYCPDQLGPAVGRELGPGFRELTFPTGDLPAFVDWVDYEERNQAASVRAFADRLLQSVEPDRRIWLVWTDGYRTFDEKCERLARALQSARGAEVIVPADPGVFERMALYEIPAATG
ncbi:MAG: glycosyltransferase family 39 protein [Acidimicrobiales bacterium]|nr:glycosyltransferase family 39 protein [Acidimicrobiales bacterium]